MVAARPFALAAAVVCAGLAFGAPARAADTAKDPVVATVDGKEIRRSEVDATIRMYGAELSKLSPGEQASVALDRLRSEERRVGKEWVSTCRSRGATFY